MKTYRFTNKGGNDTPIVPLVVGELYHGQLIFNGTTLEVFDRDTNQYYGIYRADRFEEVKPEPNRFEEVKPEPNRIVIVMEGGVIQNIMSIEPIDVIVLDYDTEGVEDDRLVQIGRHHLYVNKVEPEINPAEIEEISRLIESSDEELATCAACGKSKPETSVNMTDHEVDICDECEKEADSK